MSIAARIRPGDAAGVVLWPLAMGIVGFAVTVAWAQARFGDGDMFWHIAVGRWIIAHRALPYADPFSFTFHGQLWVPHEWLSEVVYAVLYAAFGWGGVIAATALAMGAALALLTRALLPALAPVRAAMAATLALLLCQDHLLARPHVLAMPFMVCWMVRLIDARDHGRVPAPTILPVMVVWCNLHGGFVVGLGFCLLLGLEAVIDAPGADRRGVARRWGGFLALAVASSLISPNFIQGLLMPFRLVGMDRALSLLAEWAGANFEHPNPLELWLAIAILGSTWLGLRLPPTRVVMVLVLLHMALAHLRNGELLGLIAPLLIAAPVAAQLRSAASMPIASSAVVDGGATLARAVGVAAVVAVGCLATAAGFDARGLAPGEDVAPASAVAAARAAGVSGPVLNAYGFGGYLIYVGIPPFVDGRSDLYGADFLERYFAALALVSDDFPTLLDQYGIGWTILPPTTPAVRLLDEMPGWERVYADPYAVVHRRRPGPRSK